MSTITNNFEPSVLALVSVAPRTEAELIAELKGESPYVTDQDILVSAVRLAHKGLIRQVEATGAWELNTGRNENRPAWAEHTEFDIDGEPLLHSLMVIDTERVEASIVREVNPDGEKLLCQVKSDSWVDFDSPEQVLDFIDDLKIAAKQWQRIQAGEQL